MADVHRSDALEEQIEQWRDYIRRRADGPTVDLTKWEQQLRGEIANLVRVGLAADEAFLVAAKRLGSRESAANEFAREHVDRAWQELPAVASDAGERGGPRTR